MLGGDGVTAFPPRPSFPRYFTPSMLAEELEVCSGF